MKVSLVLVSTLNGKITHGDDPEVRSWTSESDKTHYNRIWKNSRLVIMGSNTYRDNAITPSKNRLILVMTGKPGDFISDEITGQLEFTSESPRQLVERFAGSGTEMMTVVGGSKLATSFLKDSLIDEIILTLEPVIFGKGIDIFSEGDFDVDLKLEDISKANEKGTLITRFSVVK